MLRVPDQACVILQRVSWLHYLTKLQGFHEEMTLEFLQNLDNGCTTVKGRNITVSKVVIAEVSGLPAEGTIWMDKNVLLQDVFTVFQDPEEKLVRKGKGIHPTTLQQPWQELAAIM